MSETGLKKLQSLDIKKKVMIIICIVSALVYALCLSHNDCQMIVKWGYHLIDVIRSGQIGSYAQICWDDRAPNNYMIISSVITAIWELPLYIFDHIVGRDPGNEYVYYTTWYKFLVMLCTAFSLKYLYRIMEKLGADRDRMWLVSICYLLNPVFLIGAVGKGQMDPVANLFLILSFYYALEKKYYHMSFAASMLLTVKGVGFIFFFPLFLLISAPSLWRMIRYGACIISIPLLSRILEALLCPQLKEYRLYMDANVWKHVHVLFEYRIGDLPLFLTVLAIIYIMAFIRGCMKDAEQEDLLRYPMYVCAAFLILMPWSLWWGVYLLLFAGIAAIWIDDDRLFTMFAAVFSVGALLYGVLKNAGDMDCMMIKMSLFEHFFPTDWPSGILLGTLVEVAPKWTDYYALFPQVILVCATAAIMIAIYLRKQKKLPQQGFIPTVYVGLSWAVMIAVDAAFIIYAFYYCYFLGA